MIGHLRGKVLRSSPERVLLDVQGVGYEVHIPLSTFYELEAAGEDATVSLHVHTYLRDDEISLFGFWSERERQLFRKLLGVGGIGPRLARTILSGSPPDDLLAALAAGDTVRLSRTPGVGKKTAERMVLELRDKVADLAAELPEAAASPDEDLLTALQNLGYRQTEAARAITEARRELPEGAFHEHLRLALKRLSRA